MSETSRPQPHPDSIVPAGVTRVTGRVLSADWRETDWGMTMKATLEVETTAGAYRLFGTVPAAICAAIEDRPADLVGRMLAFDADLSPAPDAPDFGFYRRPRSAELLPVTRANADPAARFWLDPREPVESEVEAELIPF